MTKQLDHWHALVDAINEEDRLLRQCLTLLPRDERDVPVNPDALSFKEILGHIAFWDEFTVHFFECKLDAVSCSLSPPVEFEEQSRLALEQTRALPFGEVLARYLESTGALVAFLKAHWDELNSQQRHDFWVPLKHRRQHRIDLYEAHGLASGDDPGDSMAAGA